MYAIDNIIIEPTNNWPHINNQVLTINIGITNLIILIVNRPSKMMVINPLPVPIKSIEYIFHKQLGLTLIQ